MTRFLAIMPAIFLVTALIGCQKDAAEEYEASEASEEHAEMEMVEHPDTTGASVWAHLHDSDYQNNWALWPDKGEFYTGQEPHGMLLTTYLNEVALAALSSKAGTMPEGAIVVKENYMPDSMLAAVTVMYKVTGYNPDHSDWFFTKHRPDGSLDEMPNGMAMEGRLGGCQACHGAVAINDYLFTGSLSE